MKLTLDQLRVDSYATQVIENELTEVKGGTTWYCVGVAVISAAAAIAAIDKDDDCTTTTTTTSCTMDNGCTVETTVQHTECN